MIDLSKNTKNRNKNKKYLEEKTMNKKQTELTTTLFGIEAGAAEVMDLTRSIAEKEIVDPATIKLLLDRIKIKKDHYERILNQSIDIDPINENFIRAKNMISDIVYWYKQIDNKYKTVSNNEF